MNSQSKVVGPSKTNLVKSTSFVLKSPLKLPVKGLHNVTIGEPTNETGMENYVQINRIRVPVVGIKDSQGGAYALDKVYNIGPNGRGLTSLLSDYAAWSGVKVAKEDVYGFNCNAAMKDQAAVVDVGYHVNGAKVTAYIKAFYPAGTVEAVAAAQV